MFLLGVVLAVTAQQTVSAAPSLTTEDQVKFTFPLPDSASNIFSFILFSTEGDVPNVSVQVRQVKTPDGAALPLEAISAALETGTVSRNGARVSLTLDPKYFISPGDYRVVLFFHSATGTPSLSSTILVNRPAADINVDELKDQTVALTRPLPFFSASHEFALHVRESTGKVPINDLKVIGQSIYVKDTKEMAPGAVTVTLSPEEANIAPGAPKTLKVRLSDLRHAGAFDTRLLVTSPSFNSGKAIPIKVTVQDWVLFPLLAIAAGVLGGYLTRRFVAVVKPQNQNNLELLRLQHEVERFREVVKKPASVETIYSLLAQLRRLSESNEVGDFAAVTQEMPRLRQTLDEFRKAQVQAEGDVQTALSSLLNQVEVLEQSGTLTPDEKPHVHSIKDKLTDIERVLRLGMVEDAQEKTENVKQLLVDLRTRKFVNYFKELKLEFLKLNTSEQARAAAEILINQIQAALNDIELDKVRSKLDEFKIFIAEQAQRSRPRSARETTDVVAVLPEVPAALPEAAPFTHIEINTLPEERIAGAVIDFDIVDVERIIQRGDRVRWYFGDVGSFETQNGNASHRYSQSGRYQVRVEVVRNGTLAKTMSKMLNIAPGELEQARAGVVQDILRNEKVLSWIALLLAIIGGVIFLYSGKLFGTLVDYLMAILWGFGLDNSVKGFAAVLGKISST